MGNATPCAQQRGREQFESVSEDDYGRVHTRRWSGRIQLASFSNTAAKRLSPTSFSDVKEGHSPTPFSDVILLNYHAEHSDSNGEGERECTVQKEEEREQNTVTEKESSTDSETSPPENEINDFLPDLNTSDPPSDAEPSLYLVQREEGSDPDCSVETRLEEEELGEEQTLEKGTEEPNGVDSSPTPMISVEILEGLPLKSKWFIQIFVRACHSHGIMNPDLFLSEATALKMDRWIENFQKNDRTVKNRRKWVSEHLEEIMKHWDEDRVLSLSGEPTLEVIADYWEILVVENLTRKGRWE